jgi:hypothetical protein
MYNYLRTEGVQATTLCIRVEQKNFFLGEFLKDNVGVLRGIIPRDPPPP